MSNRRKIEPYYLYTLLELVRLGAKSEYTKVATSELGKRLGVTQQAASFRLKELEKLGYISRKKVGKRVAVRIAEEGLASLASVYVDLNEILQVNTNELEFHGRVFRGLGQGSFYISLPKFRKQFAKFLGFEPYPGTLNIRLHSPVEIHLSRLLRSSKSGIEIHAFKDSHIHETFGPLKCFKALINKEYDGAVVFTDKTHYNESVLEIISPHHLRKKLGIDQDSDKEITVRVIAS